MSSAVKKLFPRVLQDTLRHVYLPAVFFLLTLAGCATSGDVKNLDKDNRVQDQRLTAIEESSGREIARMSKELRAMQQELRSTRGQLLNMSKKLDRLVAEQAAVTESQEKLAAQNRNALRRLDKSEKENRSTRNRQAQELDAVRLALADMEKLMKTALAQLPSKTKADQHFRAAFLSMVSGELDIAADRFNSFSKTFADDSRVPEAMYRRGQAYFLMRRYDHAIVPFFELVDKYGGHKLAVDARWMLARSLEETGDLKLAREFYAQLITEDTIHKADATRRVYFINELYPKTKSSPKPALTKASKKPASPNPSPAKQKPKKTTQAKKAK